MYVGISPALGNLHYHNANELPMWVHYHDSNELPMWVHYHDANELPMWGCQFGGQWTLRVKNNDG